MKRVIVTGAEGFIGRCLVRTLKKAGHTVISLGRKDGDITDASTLQRIKDAPVDHLFHLAGRTFVPDSWSVPEVFQRVNVDGTLNVLEYCRNHKTSLTYVSAYLYGNPKSLPIKETDQVVPNNPYAMSKQQAEAWCQFYATHFDMPIIIARPFNIYGIGQKNYFLIPEIISQIKAGKEIHVKDLLPRRDYCYLDDLVEGLICTMANKSGCQVYNFGYGSSLSVQNIIDIIQNVAGTSLKVTAANEPRKNEIMDVYADITKARQDLNWNPKWKFREGIKKILTSWEKSK